jgi:hypothetical protein
MRLSSFSLIWAIIYAGVGLGLLLFPASFMVTYGVKLDDSGILMAKMLGSALTAFALIFYWNRSQPLSNPAKRLILLGSFIYNLLATPTLLLATLSGVMNHLGWLPVGLHIFLSITFGYFVFKKT